MLNIKKFISILITNCIILSFVIGPTTANAMTNEEATARYKQIFKDFMLPYSYGQITSAHYAGTDRLIINIQDLHCHPKVQKNISNIIETFDKSYGVNKIYLEGAYGQVNTGWLSDKIDSVHKLEILDKMLETGRLTGAEYYSALSGKTEIINGLEEKGPYLENLKRFGEIVENQEKINLILNALDESVCKLKKQYYTKRQIKIDELSQKYREGDISPKKYYALLLKHIERLGIDISKYENTFTYILLLNLQKQLDYNAITKDLQNLVLFLKENLNYNAYQMLEDNTEKFSNPDKLYGYIIKISKQLNLDLSVNFAHLDNYFRYIEMGQKINSLELIEEEKKLTEEINTRFSETKAQREVVFITNFEKYIKDYVSSKITSRDYEYYKENINKYKQLWNKYVDNRILSLLDEYITEADKFYKINTDRNIYFTNNMFKETDDLNKIETELQAKDDINKIIENMKGVKEVDIVITGGFHSQTVTEILKKHGVSYIVITPKVSGGTKFAEDKYYEIAREQSKISFQTLATLIASLSPIAQQEIFNALNNNDTEQKNFEKLTPEEKARELRRIVSAKLLESDDTGDVVDNIMNEINKHSKEPVSEDLLNKIDVENFKKLLDENLEDLQKVIDTLQEPALIQSLTLLKNAIQEQANFLNEYLTKQSSKVQQRKTPVKQSKKMTNIRNVLAGILISITLLVGSLNIYKNITSAHSESFTGEPVSTQEVVVADNEQSSVQHEYSTPKIDMILEDDNLLQGVYDRIGTPSYHPKSKEDVRRDLETSKLDEVKAVVQNQIYETIEQLGAPFSYDNMPEVIFVDINSKDPYLLGTAWCNFFSIGDQDFNFIFVPINYNEDGTFNIPDMRSTIAHEWTHIINKDDVSAGFLSPIEDEYLATRNGYLMWDLDGFDFSFVVDGVEYTMPFYQGLRVFGFNRIIEEKYSIIEQLQQYNQSITYSNLYYDKVEFDENYRTKDGLRFIAIEMTSRRGSFHDEKGNEVFIYAVIDETGNIELQVQQNHDFDFSQCLTLKEQSGTYKDYPVANIEYSASTARQMLNSEDMFEQFIRSFDTRNSDFAPATEDDLRLSLKASSAEEVRPFVQQEIGKAVSFFGFNDDYDKIPEIIFMKVNPNAKNKGTLLKSACAHSATINGERKDFIIIPVEYDDNNQFMLDREIFGTIVHEWTHHLNRDQVESGKMTNLEDEYLATRNGFVVLETQGETFSFSVDGVEYTMPFYQGMRVFGFNGIIENKNTIIEQLQQYTDKGISFSNLYYRDVSFSPEHRTKDGLRFIAIELINKSAHFYDEKGNKVFVYAVIDEKGNIEIQAQYGQEGEERHNFDFSEYYIQKNEVFSIQDILEQNQEEITRQFSKFRVDFSFNDLVFDFNQAKQNSDGSLIIEIYDAKNEKKDAKGNPIHVYAIITIDQNMQLIVSDQELTDSSSHLTMNWLSNLLDRLKITNFKKRQNIINRIENPLIILSVLFPSTVGRWFAARHLTGEEKRNFTKEQKESKISQVLKNVNAVIKEADMESAIPSVSFFKKLSIFVTLSLNKPKMKDLANAHEHWNAIQELREQEFIDDEDLEIIREFMKLTIDNEYISYEKALDQLPEKYKNKVGLEKLFYISRKYNKDLILDFLNTESKNKSLNRINPIFMGFVGSDKIDSIREKVEEVLRFLYSSEEENGIKNKIKEIFGFSVENFKSLFEIAGLQAPTSSTYKQTPLSYTEISFFIELLILAGDFDEDSFTIYFDEELKFPNIERLRKLQENNIYSFDLLYSNIELNDNNIDRLKLLVGYLNRRDLNRIDISNNSLALRIFLNPTFIREMKYTDIVMQYKIAVQLSRLFAVQTDKPLTDEILNKIIPYLLTFFNDVTDFADNQTVLDGETGILGLYSKEQIGEGEFTPDGLEKLLKWYGIEIDRNNKQYFKMKDGDKKQDFRDSVRYSRVFLKEHKVKRIFIDIDAHGSEDGDILLGDNMSLTPEELAEDLKIALDSGVDLEKEIVLNLGNCFAGRVFKEELIKALKAKGVKNLPQIITAAGVENFYAFGPTSNLYLAMLGNKQKSVGKITVGDIIRTKPKSSNHTMTFESRDKTLSVKYESLQENILTILSQEAIKVIEKEQDVNNLSIKISEEEPILSQNIPFNDKFINIDINEYKNINVGESNLNFLSGKNEEINIPVIEELNKDAFISLSFLNIMYSSLVNNTPSTTFRLTTTKNKRKLNKMGISEDSLEGQRIINKSENWIIVLGMFFPSIRDWFIKQHHDEPESQIRQGFDFVVANSGEFIKSVTNNIPTSRIARLCRVLSILRNKQAMQELADAHTAWNLRDLSSASHAKIVQRQNSVESSDDQTSVIEFSKPSLRNLIDSIKKRISGLSSYQQNIYDSNVVSVLEQALAEIEDDPGLVSMRSEVYNKIGFKVTEFGSLQKFIDETGNKQLGEAINHLLLSAILSQDDIFTQKDYNAVRNYIHDPSFTEKDKDEQEKRLSQIKVIVRLYGYISFRNKFLEQNHKEKITSNSVVRIGNQDLTLYQWIHICDGHSICLNGNEIGKASSPDKYFEEETDDAEEKTKRALLAAIRMQTLEEVPSIKANPDIIVLKDGKNVYVKKQAGTDFFYVVVESVNGDLVTMYIVDGKTIKKGNQYDVSAFVENFDDSRTKVDMFINKNESMFFLPNTREWYFKKDNQGNIFQFKDGRWQKLSAESNGLVKLSLNVISPNANLEPNKITEERLKILEIKIRRNTYACFYYDTKSEKWYEIQNKNLVEVTNYDTIRNAMESFNINGRDYYFSNALNDVCFDENFKLIQEKDIVLGALNKDKSNRYGTIVQTKRVGNKNKKFLLLFDYSTNEWFSLNLSDLRTRIEEDQSGLIEGNKSYYILPNGLLITMDATNIEDIQETKTEFVIKENNGDVYVYVKVAGKWYRYKQNGGGIPNRYAVISFDSDNKSYLYIRQKVYEITDDNDLSEVQSVVKFDVDGKQYISLNNNLYLVDEQSIELVSNEKKNALIQHQKYGKFFNLLLNTLNVVGQTLALTLQILQHSEYMKAKNVVFVDEKAVISEELRRQAMDVGINIVKIKIITEQTEEIKGGQVIDEQNKIRMLFNTNKNELVVYSKQGISLTEKRIKELVETAYSEGRANFQIDSDQVITFVDGITNITLEDIQNKIEISRKNGIIKASTEIKFDLRNETLSVNKCDGEFASTGANTFIITLEQSNSEEIENLRKKGYRFVVYHDATDIPSIIELDGIQIDATNVTTKEQAISILRKLQKMCNIEKTISIEFSEDIYASLGDIDIFGEYGVLPILKADNMTAIRQVRGKKEVKELTKQTNIEEILNTEDVVGVIGDSDESRDILSVIKDILKIKTSKYEKGLNVGLREGHVCDMTNETLRNILISGEIELKDVDLLGLQKDDAIYLRYLLENNKKEESVGFVIGIAMNNMKQQWKVKFDRKIDNDSFVKEGKGQYEKGLLLLMLSLTMSGVNIEELLEENSFERDDSGWNVSAKDMYRIIGEKSAVIITRVLNENDKKIKVLHDTDILRAKEDFRDLNVLIQDRFRKIENYEGVKISALSIRSILSAA